MTRRAAKSWSDSANLVKQDPPYGFVAAKDGEYDNVREVYRRSIVQGRVAMPLRAISLPWGKLRLAARVMLVSGVVLMLFGATFLALIVSSEVRVNRDELDQRLDHEVNFLAPAIAESAVVGDYALIKQMLDVRVQQPSVLRISWTDTQGITLTSESDDVRR